MEKCYEYLGCDKKDCIMYKRSDNKPCWEVEETLCCSPGVENMKKELGGKKINACVKCIYYKAVNELGA